MYYKLCRECSTIEYYVNTYKYNILYILCTIYTEICFYFLWYDATIYGVINKLRCIDLVGIADDVNTNSPGLITQISYDLKC